MRILAITQDVGNSAVGIVAERLLAELSKNCCLDLIVSKYNPSLESHFNSVDILHHLSIHYKIDKWLFDIFGTDFYIELIKKKVVLTNNYDFVLSIGANSQFYGLIIGRYLHVKYGIKWANYFVDAIPAPLGWSNYDLHYKKTLCFIKRNLPDVDIMAAVNKEMLEYEKKLFVNKESMKSVVLYPPTTLTRISVLNEPSSEIYRFVYTGNIYGKRTSKYIIEAFADLCKVVSNVELIFVGDTLIGVNEEKSKFEEDVRKRILTHRATNDVESYYKDATALIDIDAVVENDVFLSSKISNYLSYNRPIICETGDNSPSRTIFSNIGSVIQCHHNPTELKDAMYYSIVNFKRFDYSDREDILNMFNSTVVANKLFQLMMQ